MFEITNAEKLRDAYTLLAFIRDDVPTTTAEQKSGLAAFIKDQLADVGPLCFGYLLGVKSGHRAGGRHGLEVLCAGHLAWLLS